MKPSKDINFLIGDPIYIVGHKKPDLDSIASAFAYQHYRHAKGDFNYVGVRCGIPNVVTKWVFSYFKQDMPLLLKSMEGKKVVLVDHSDPDQRLDDWQKGEIVEVLDHHRLDLSSSSPLKITIRPYGSTATLIGYKFIKNGLDVSPGLAGVILSAILDDTLALRSPVTTSFDRTVAGEMANRSGVSDMNSFARKLFSRKDIWGKMSPSEVVNCDLKELEKDGMYFVVSQVETMDNRVLEERERELIAYMNFCENKSPSDLRLVMLTDLLSNNCIMLATGSKVDDLEEIFDVKLINRRKLYLPGVLSRKKQVFPPILDYYS